jgi:hypothetical protein
LFQSLEHPSEAEIERLWFEEAVRHDRAWNTRPDQGPDACDVLRDASMTSGIS